MIGQNINQYYGNNWGVKLNLDSHDMSLTSDEKDFNQEVVFSPYLIAQTYGQRLPIYFDINNPITAQNLTLDYKNYNYNNIFVSQNYYSSSTENCFSSTTLCDVGLTGIDNGLVSSMTGESITVTNGFFNDNLKFDRYHFDRRLKLFQVTGYTSNNLRFSGFNKTVLYEVVSKNSPYEGKYHELYGGFYQGFYKLFGFDYDILPQRMNKGWSVEVLLKPRLFNEYEPDEDETTLNELYPNNKNIFFYLGTRAENKFYHHADGSPSGFTGYTRVTTELQEKLQTCNCCTTAYTDSRCIYVYPPRSKNNIHDPHVNYGCDICSKPSTEPTCITGSTTCTGCGCTPETYQTCGWECKTHTCNENYTTTTTTNYLTTTTTNYLTTTTTNYTTTTTTVFTDSIIKSSIENTCESNPLDDSLSNNIAFKLCGDAKNPKIGVRVLKLTGDCVTVSLLDGSQIGPDDVLNNCVQTGITYQTGYTVTNYCTDKGIYDRCETLNPTFLNEEHWFQFNAVWERYTWLNDCDLFYRGGLGDITQIHTLESLSHNSISLITVPYTQTGSPKPEEVTLTQLNEKWLQNKEYRNGRLKIYINGKLFDVIENFEEVIPRGLNTDKEKQIGVPFNISWGGGTQGLREHLTFSSTTLLNGPYIQDPECLTVNDLSGTTFSGLNTNILIEQNFAGTFDGGISQFRIYVTPLSSPEIKHNFNVLKNTFRMYNPDCPDCKTEVCLPNDFTYVLQNGQLQPNVTLLGRLYHRDIRDDNYLINDHFNFQAKPVVTNIIVRPRPTPTPSKTKKPLPTPTPTPTKTRQLTPTITKSITPTPTSSGLPPFKYWGDEEWWGNQGNTPQCVGYAWAHWIEDGPITHSGATPIINPSLIYSEAQKIDEWPGENYDGTSVRAGAKYLLDTGKIKSYYWAFDVNTLINTVYNLGPVVVGTYWYQGMFYPDINGVIKPTGRIVGGHAYVINGIDLVKQQFRIKNSWGRNWGKQGRAFISFADMSKLISMRGEICLAIENNF